MFLTFGIAVAGQPWFWATAGAVALTLLLLNVLVLAAVHARRLRQYVRTRRARRFDERLRRYSTSSSRQPAPRDPGWLRTEIGGFDELERPIAAMKLIERMRPASEDERRQTLDVMREIGAVECTARSTASRMPWRRALAIRTLGWIGAEETVPALIERLSDRNRHVRELAVRALGRIGDSIVLPDLARLYDRPDVSGREWSTTR